MKLPVMTDSHAGARSDSTVFLDRDKKFYDNILFPTIRDLGCDTILHLGDILDRRKFINFVTANRLRVDFMEPLTEMGLTLDHVLGNHDVYYKDRNDISGVVELYGNSRYPINIISETTEKMYGDELVLLVPWICEENEARSIEMIKRTKAQVAMGHLELSGFEMSKGSIMDHGMSADLFRKFDVVASGHYHHGSQKGNVHYLGATGEFDWGDNDDPRGFHIFDTDTRIFTPIRNPYAIFHRLSYDDTDKSFEDLIEGVDFEKMSNGYVKLIVTEKTNPYLFDKFVEELEKCGLTDLQIVEEYAMMSVMSSDEILSQAEDTITIMDKYIETVQSNLDRNELTRLLRDTYREAVMVM